MSDLEILMDAMLESLDRMSQRIGEIEQTAKTLQTAIEAIEPGRDGRDGLPGRDGAAGADGIGFDDFTMSFDGDRTLTFEASANGRTKSFTAELPMVIYRGVWKDAGTYAKGDAVTADGSMWIAREAPSGKPGTMASGWQLAVKRGTK